MAHYAFLNSENIVIDVIVGKDEGQGTDWEVEYGNFRGLTCKRTSYNTYSGVHLNGGTPFRKNYAGIGFSYNEAIDGFVPPKPFDSWTINETTGLWEPPTEYPDDYDENIYEWDESTLTWNLIT
tara:strand:+ start:929 stop:1300 length:372 start_codon:yes stop_codon:yes gene_type:complete